MIYEYIFMFKNVNNFISKFLKKNKECLINKIIMIFLYF